MSKTAEDTKKERRKTEGSGRNRMTVINRTVVSSGGGAIVPMRTSMVRTSYGGSGGMGFSVSPGTYSAASQTGVKGVVTGREKEKKEMQGLNERFAGYIEKVRYLQALVNAKDKEIEKLKGLKGFDADQIRKQYENEIQRLNDLVQEVTEEKDGYVVRVASLEDDVGQLENERDNFERENKDLRGKLNSLNEQIAQLEGEVATLRRRTAALDDENQSLKNKYTQLQNQLKATKQDLDQETMNHLNEANRANSLEDQLLFMQATYEAEIAELKRLLDRDTHADIKEHWKGELASAIRQIQEEYDLQLDNLRGDMESKYEAQYQQFRTGATRDNMEAIQVKEENSRLKTRYNDTSSSIAQLQAELAAFKKRLENSEELAEERQRELDAERAKHDNDNMRYKAELEDMLREIQGLMDAKLSLEMEIGCYKSLLSAEEQRLGLRSVIGDLAGVQSSGGAALSQIIQSSQSASEQTGKLRVQRTSKGPIAFSEIDANGAAICIENTTSGLRAKDQNMNHWRIERETMNGQKFSYTFPDVVIAPSSQLRLFSEKHKDDHRKRHDDIVVTKYDSWGSGGAKTKLFDPQGQEKADIIHTLVF